MNVWCKVGAIVGFGLGLLFDWGNPSSTDAFGDMLIGGVLGAVVVAVALAGRDTLKGR